MTNVKSCRLGDLIAAPFTPLHDDGEINFEFLPTYADYLVSTHFTGIFINGTLAEGFSMTQEERKQLTQGWMDASNGRLKVIVHVGTNCQKDSKELARHAQEVGADAIAAFSPSYYKPRNEEAMVEVMAEIAGAASNLPFYYYDINFCTGVYMDVSKIMSLAKVKIPTLAGLKYSSRELPNAHNCLLTIGEDRQIVMGTDNQYLSCLALDIPGVVSASYLGNLFYDMKRAWDGGHTDTARRLQGKAQTINNIRAKQDGGVSTAKSIFNVLTGYDVGPVRLPLSTLTSDQLDELRKDFKDAGLADIAKPI